MSLFESFALDDSSSEEEYEWDKDNNIDLIMMVHMEKDKRPKHGDFVIGREVIRRRRQEGNHGLMINYFRPNPVYPERYF